MRKTTESIKDKPRLVPRPDVARMLGISSNSIRKWVATGDFPEPHSIIHRTWFYRLDILEAYIATGRWPEGVKFKWMRGFKSIED